LQTEIVRIEEEKDCWVNGERVGGRQANTAGGWGEGQRKQGLIGRRKGITKEGVWPGRKKRKSWCEGGRVEGVEGCIS
jgi:hypothetical protein